MRVVRGEHLVHFSTDSVPTDSSEEAIDDIWVASSLDNVRDDWEAVSSRKSDSSEQANWIISESPDGIRWSANDASLKVSEAHSRAVLDFSLIDVVVKRVYRQVAHQGIFMRRAHRVLSVAQVSYVEHVAEHVDHGHLHVLRLFKVLLDNPEALPRLVAAVLSDSQSVEFVVDHFGELLAPHVVQADVKVVRVFAQKLVAYPAATNPHSRVATAVFA